MVFDCDTMPCYHPIQAYYGVKASESGKFPLVFVRPASVNERDTVNRWSLNERGKALLIPCGTCIGCQLERARQWAMRCVHEAQMHERNSFVTLTYSPKFSWRRSQRNR